MRTKYYIYAVIVIFTFSVTLSFASGGNLRGKHLENKLECADCHGTNEPTKRASQTACQECHGDMSDDQKIQTLKDANGGIHKSTIHTSHAGQLRCTLCHQVHKPSILYCNEGCHHTFDIKVP